MLKQFLRLYLLIMIPTVLLFILGSWGLNQFNDRSFVEGVRGGMKIRYSWVLNVLKSEPSSQWAATLESARRVFPNGSRIETEAEANRYLSPNAGERARLARGEVALVPLANGRTYAYQRVAGTPYVIGSDMILTSSSSIASYLSLVLFAALAVAPILWFWFRPFWRDLERLQGMTERIGSGNFDVPDTALQSSTMQPFASAINRMATRIHELLEAQARLTSGVAHELTTPITQLVFALEMVRNAGDLEAVRHLTSGMATDLQELDSLVAELLEYARLEHAANYEPEQTSLSELIQQAVDSAEHIARRDGKTIMIDRATSESDEVTCDAHQMHRAVSNLLRNAALYARSRIEVSSEFRDGRNWIHVDDDGPGIPAAQREHLFEPFTRLDQSRTRGTGGHGLGLAIVLQVAKLHRGLATIDHSPAGGARVSIGW